MMLLKTSWLENIVLFDHGALKLLKYQTIHVQVSDMVLYKHMIYKYTYKHLKTMSPNELNSPNK